MGRFGQLLDNHIVLSCRLGPRVSETFYFFIFYFFLDSKLPPQFTVIRHRLRPLSVQAKVTENLRVSTSITSESKGG
jgi:hypothetical protein